MRVESVVCNFKMLDKTKLTKIIIKIVPRAQNLLKKKKYNLVEEGLIDSFAIIQILLEIEKINKRKIKIGNLSRENFQDISSILKLVNKK